MNESHTGHADALSKSALEHNKASNTPTQSTIMMGMIILGLHRLSITLVNGSKTEYDTKIGPHCIRCWIG